MGKFSLAVVSLIAAVPGGVLAFLVIRAFLSKTEKMSGMMIGLAATTLLMAVIVTLLPVFVLLFGSKKEDRFAEDEHEYPPEEISAEQETVAYNPNEESAEPAGMMENKTIADAFEDGAFDDEDADDGMELGGEDGEMVADAFDDGDFEGDDFDNAGDDDWDFEEEEDQWS